MADIKLRLQSYGTLVMTSLESRCNEYISNILYTALRIAEDATKKKFSMRPKYKIIGDKSCGWVDYAIKSNKVLFSIEFVEEALVENSEEYKILRKGLPEVSVPAVNVFKFVVDQQNNVNTKSTENKIIDDCLLKQTLIPELEQCKPDSKTNNTVPEREPDSETLVASLDSAIPLNEKNGQGCSSFPQSEISQNKKNTQFSENSNNSLLSKLCNAFSSFECDEK
ncbi:11402_t:CDS:2, partial [Funneliformis caledonium]